MLKEKFLVRGMIWGPGSNMGQPKEKVRGLVRPMGRLCVRVTDVSVLLDSFFSWLGSFASSLCFCSWPLPPLREAKRKSV